MEARQRPSGFRSKRMRSPERHDHWRPRPHRREPDTPDYRRAPHAGNRSWRADAGIYRPGGARRPKAITEATDAFEIVFRNDAHQFDVQNATVSDVAKCLTVDIPTAMSKMTTVNPKYDIIQQGFVPSASGGRFHV